MNNIETVKDCLEYLKQFDEISPADLELNTIIEDGTDFEHKHEIISAVLVLLKNKEVFNDPILFAQVCLGISGIAPDFMEFEFCSPEIIALFFRTCKELEKQYGKNFKTEELDDDVRRYIAVCCAEDGMYFLKLELEQFQPELLDILKTVYDVDIPEQDLKDCQVMFDQYYTFMTEAVPEDSPEFIQIKKNYVIRDYVTEIYK